MELTDWRDHTHKARMRAYMISPQNLDVVIGEITGVEWSSCKISAAYYSDTKTSASLTLKDGNWQRNTFVRLVYEIPDIDYRREIGTYLVSNDDSERRNGHWITHLELQSMLYALDCDLAPEALTLVPGTSALTAMKNEITKGLRTYSVETVIDYRTAETTFYETGGSRLQRLFTMRAAKHYIDVNPHGDITISEYIELNTRPTAFSLALFDPRGVVYDDSVGRTTNWLELPTQAVVSYKFTVKDEISGETHDEEMVATTQLSAESPSSARSRGYNTTIYTSLNDEDTPTMRRLQQIADGTLSGNSIESVKWSIKTKFLPIWEGDVVEINVQDGPERYRGWHRCLVENLDISGPYWDMTLTLKQIQPGDDE